MLSGRTDTRAHLHAIEPFGVLQIGNTRSERLMEKYGSLHGQVIFHGDVPCSDDFSLQSLHVHQETNIPSTFDTYVDISTEPPTVLRSVRR